MIIRFAASSAALAAALAAGAAAQTPVPTPPQASTPALQNLAPLPGIGVDWPALPGVPVAVPGAPAAPLEIDTELAEVRYTLTVVGLAPLGLDGRFRELSSLYKGRKADANTAQIDRRVVEDSDLIDQLLRERGYYGGRVTPQIVPGKPGQAGAVTLTVDPGPLYHFTTIDLKTPPQSTPGLVEGLIGIKPGDAVAAEPVQTAQDALKTRLATKGYPFPTIDAPAITIDHATRTATLEQTIAPGPRGRFGTIRTNPKSLLNGPQLQRLARWKPGDVYDSADLDDLRRAMISTGLFGSVNITPVAAGPAADGDTMVDLRIRTEAAPLRTLSATAGYSTSQGVRVEASWAHRNLLPPGGAVTFSAIAAEREQALGATLRRQNWRARDVTLTLRAQYDRQQLPAFKAQTLTLGASIERETNLIWQKKWYYSLGVEVVPSRETDRSSLGDPTRNYFVGALPLSLTYDGSDNLLDPTRGFRLTLRGSPEISVDGPAFGYAKTQIEGSVYQTVGRGVTLAARAHFGSILGASRGNIAPSRRFYAGGGGSLRGYGFQQVGPQDAGNSPTGGDSIVEGSFEARVRLGNFGIVPFIDAGQVYSATIPGFNDIKFGAGLGVRYYTSFGPVRIDVATPVNGRPNDARVQFYVSIGQAF